VKGKSTSSAGSYFKQMTMPLNAALPAARPARHWPIRPGEERVPVRAIPSERVADTRSVIPGNRVDPAAREKTVKPDIPGNDASSIMDTRPESKRLLGPSSPSLPAAAPTEEPDGEPDYPSGELPRSHSIQFANPQPPNQNRVEEDRVEVEEANNKSSGTFSTMNAERSEIAVRDEPVALEKSSVPVRNFRMDNEHHRGRAINLEPSLTEPSLTEPSSTGLSSTGLSSSMRQTGQAGESTVHIGTIEVRVISNEPPRPTVIAQPAEPRAKAPAAGPSRSSAAGSLARGLQSPFGLRQG
jgi:hypothetical protein